ncbi:MAG: lactate utilization protein [Sporomusaceae bacterium]|nr:lactate utilization protein [Sporomusaceae bacterium]
MQQLIEKLQSRNINAYWVRNSAEAKAIALELIPAGATVAMGNSLSLRETGIFDALISGKYDVINQFEAGISPGENISRRKRGLLADVYFTGTSAVTMDGELVNIDGKGNRVAAMLFGPDKVVVVVGRNKVVRDQAHAWQRLREKAAPSLARKLGRATPCATSGVCSDCSSPERICRCYTVIGSQMPADKERIHVIIVDEDLGI